MALSISPQEILETIRMVQMEKLDIRTITMGISLRDCAHPDLKSAAIRAYDKICRKAARLVAVGGEIEREYGLPIVNQRISVTPIALVAEPSRYQVLRPSVVSTTGAHRNFHVCGMKATATSSAI